MALQFITVFNAGNEELGRISEYIHELAGLNDVLRTNHEHLLCESIDRFWLKVSSRRPHAATYILCRQLQFAQMYAIICGPSRFA